MLADTWTGGNARPALYCRIGGRAAGLWGQLNSKRLTPIRITETNSLKGKKVVGMRRDKQLSWVEKAFLEGKLPLGEFMAYQSVVKRLPKRFEADPQLND